MSKIDYSKVPHIPLVRKRTGMYVGGTNYFGLINYFVCPINLLLAYKASKISVALESDGFHIESDADIEFGEFAGKLIPFEHFTNDLGHGFEGPVLTALSNKMEVEALTSNGYWHLKYQRGEKVFEKIDLNTIKEPNVKIHFSPDESIFSVTSISIPTFQSYFNRISHLYPKVQFKFEANGESNIYQSPNGIRDMFDAFSAPFQLLHEPIHIFVEQKNYSIEIVYAFQSWRENLITAYINNGRAVEGGSHEQGLAEAFDYLSQSITSKQIANGVVAIMSIIYPDVVWEGCIKREIRDNELQKLVKETVVSKTKSWLKSHPDTAQELENIQLFQFPPLWYDEKNQESSEES